MDERTDELMYLAAEQGLSVAQALTFIGLAIVDHTEALSYMTRRLGTGDASTHFGALEAVGMSIEKVAESLNNVASAADGRGGQ